jgi:hypothetical protein
MVGVLMEKSAVSAVSAVVVVPANPPRARHRCRHPLAIQCLLTLFANMCGGKQKLA